ncbi:MAG: hypothetical protein AMS18_05615, partial [Gemmatimonas sp. SG8_17]
MQDLDLRRLERRAWRSFHQDGVKDVFIGLLLMSIGITDLLGNDFLLLALQFSLVAGLVLAKRLITAPRLGRVEFSPERKSKKRRALGLLALSGGLGLVLYLVFVGTGALSTWIDDRAWIMPPMLGLWVFSVFALGAYYMDFARMYWIGLVSGAAFGLALALRAP